MKRFLAVYIDTGTPLGRTKRLSAEGIAGIRNNLAA